MRVFNNIIIFIFTPEEWGERDKKLQEAVWRASRPLSFYQMVDFYSLFGQMFSRKPCSPLNHCTRTVLSSLTKVNILSNPATRVIGRHVCYILEQNAARYRVACGGGEPAQIAMFTDTHSVYRQDLACPHRAQALRACAEPDPGEVKRLYTHQCRNLLQWCGVKELSWSINGCVERTAVPLMRNGDSTNTPSHRYCTLLLDACTRIRPHCTGIEGNKETGSPEALPRHD